jgi:DNA-binding MarR family transcriptional regulator
MRNKITAQQVLDRMSRHWPEAVTPTTELMMRVYRLNDLVLENARRETSRYGLTFTEFEVLLGLRSASPPHELSPTELYSAVLISSGGLTKILHKLEAHGLICRIEHETDGRSKLVRLTEAGRNLAAKAMAGVLESDRKLLTSGLSSSERQQLTLLLSRLLHAIEA